MVKIMESPIKMDDLWWFGGIYPYFWKHPYRYIISNPDLQFLIQDIDQYCDLLR